MKNIDVVFYVDLALLLTSIVLFYLAIKVKESFLCKFDYERSSKC